MIYTPKQILDMLLFCKKTCSETYESLSKTDLQDTQRDVLGSLLWVESDLNKIIEDHKIFLKKEVGNG